MNLGSKAASALRWAGGTLAVAQVINWAITIYVIRLLTPEDYGIISISMMIVGFFMLINEMGLGSAIIQKKLDKKEIGTIFSVAFYFNLILAITIFSLSDYVAVFFNDERISDVVATLSILFLVTAFETVPVSMLEKSLDFKRKSSIFAFANIVGGLVTLFFATRGYGYWSITYGIIAISIIKTIGLNIVSPYIVWPKLKFTGIKKLMSFSGFVASERIAWFFYFQADIFIVGKMLGSELLGFYSVAMHVSTLVIQKFGGMLYEIAFPTFSHANEMGDDVGYYYSKATQYMSFFIFPISLGMAAVSEELVVVVLGEKWLDSSFLLLILSLAMPLRMLSSMLAPALQGVGKAKLSFYNLIVMAVVMSISFVAGSLYGVVGVSIAWITVFPVVVWLTLSWSLKSIGLKMTNILVDIRKPVIGSVLMFLCVMMVKHFANIEVPYLNLIISVVTGVTIYALFTYLFMKGTLLELRKIAIKK